MNVFKHRFFCNFSDEKSKEECLPATTQVYHWVGEDEPPVSDFSVAQYLTPSVSPSPAPGWFVEYLQSIHEVHAVEIALSSEWNGIFIAYPSCYPWGEGYKRTLKVLPVAQFLGHLPFLKGLIRELDKWPRSYRISGVWARVVFLYSEGGDQRSVAEDVFLQ